MVDAHDSLQQQPYILDEHCTVVVALSLHEVSRIVLHGCPFFVLFGSFCAFIDGRFELVVVSFNDLEARISVSLSWLLSSFDTLSLSLSHTDSNCSSPSSNCSAHQQSVHETW